MTAAARRKAATSSESPEHQRHPGTPSGDQAEEVLHQHDTSSRYRTDLGWWAWLIGGISAVFTVYHLYFALDRVFTGWMHGALHLAGATALVFLLFPASRRLLKPAPDTRRAVNLLVGRHSGVPWYDVVLASSALYCNFYIFFQYEYLQSNQVAILGYSDHDLFVAVLGIVLVLEATRRCVGLPIVIIAGLAIVYGIWGDRLPIFSHRGDSFDGVAADLYLSTRGIFGTPLQVSANFIFLFLFFAVVLLRTNIGQFFNDLAFRAAGRFTGGPAKAAVGASGLQGMVSGSSVANTVASGSFTIPIMKKAGFKPHVAAATEATASTGGQLMPPIMGAAAFIMAQNVPGVEYNDLIVIALIPALLYFLGALLTVHFEAKRNQIRGLPIDELPSWQSLLVRIDMVLPLVVIISTLLAGMTPTMAALCGIATAIVVTVVRGFVTHMLPVITQARSRGAAAVTTEVAKMTLAAAAVMIEMFIAGARTALPVILACASAGIVAGTVTVTGLGGQLGSGLVALAGGNFLLVLFMVMIACIVLGMGLPTTANYVVTATVAAPILYSNFDVPLVAAHLFVFFFGILADITPPVCLAAYAGAGIAQANPMAAGVAALKVAFAGFLIPYVFILQPALLLEGTWDETLRYLIMTVMGMVAMASGLAGYLIARAGWLERLCLIAGGLLLIYPDLTVSIAGMATLAVALVLQALSRGRGQDWQGPDQPENHHDGDVGYRSATA